MRTEKEIKAGIKVLQEQLKNKKLPDMAKVKTTEAILLLQWVLDEKK